MLAAPYILYGALLSLAATAPLAINHSRCTLYPVRCSSLFRSHRPPSNQPFKVHPISCTVLFSL
jgi:hypothetical protein